jgi:PAS domain S-box-containing protein
MWMVARTVTTIITTTATTMASSRQWVLPQRKRLALFRFLHCAFKTLEEVACEAKGMLSLLKSFFLLFWPLSDVFLSFFFLFFFSCLFIFSAASPPVVMSEWAQNEQGTHVAMISMDKTGTITTSNNGARLLFNYPSGTMCGLRVEKLMPSEFRAKHQAYVDKYVETRLSQGAIGAWKVRPAVRSDGELFDIRIALSVSSSIEQPIFSALIDPLYEATVRTDNKGKILQVLQSPWLLFGLYRDALVGQQIDVLLRHSSDWFSAGERVVMCKNVVGDEFTALLKVKKEKDSYVGCFCQAPALRVKMTLLESGVIVSCTGESKALLGYKPKFVKKKKFFFFNF